MPPLESEETTIVANEAMATLAEAPATVAIENRAKPPRRPWLKWTAMLSVPLLLVGAGLYVWLTSGRYVSTDNAYVQQDIVSISPEVGGRIVEVLVRENQRVEAGQLLFRLDPEPYRISMAQADAQIATAEARVTGLEAGYETTAADIAAARSAVQLATANYTREAELMRRGFSTRARMDAVQNALNQARAQLADAQGAATRARAALATGRSAPGVNPGILTAQTQRRQAAYQLSRTEIRAPVAGIVSQTSRLNVGQMMVAGMPALSIVANGQSWVEANFKETDLANMAVGQRATLSFDAFPDLEVVGHVASIGGGTGSEFSILPAQNATGNWVKVTQRVPVRIAFDEAPKRAMIAGLSTEVTVITSGGCN